MQILSPSEAHVRIYPSPEKEQDWLEKGAVYFMKQLGLFENLNQQSQSGKMFQVLSLQAAAKILEQSSRKCSAPKFQCLDLDDGQQQGWLELEKPKSRGEFLTHNTLEYPNAVVVCSLSEVLESSVPQKYYLSAKACQGILRRAEKRGKSLPPSLQVALEQVAQGDKPRNPGSQSQGRWIEKVLQATEDLKPMRRSFWFLMWPIISLRSDPAQPVIFQQNTRDEVRLLGGDGQIAGALAAQAGMKQQNYVAQRTVGALQERDAKGIGTTIDDKIIAFSARDSGNDAQEDITPTLKSLRFKNSHQQGSGGMAIAYGIYDEPTPKVSEEIMPTIRAREKGGGFQQSVGGKFGVRRLTPVECERLQGFPDGWTEGQADTQRYKQLGNAVAVVCTEWLGKRITQSLPK